VSTTQSHLRVVRDGDVRRPTSGDPALRPTSFADYVGQTEVVSQLRGAVSAARKRGWQLDHVLLTGPAGYGKTSIAAVIAGELGAKLHVTSAPAIEHKGALATLLTALGEGDVLFVDEIHALDRKIAETIYSALEDGVIDLSAGKRVIRVTLPKFTLVAATTHAGKLPAPLRDRFGITCQLRPYGEAELTQIVARSASLLGVAIDDAGTREIARRSRGTPRVANKLLRRVRDAVANSGAGAIGGVDVAAALDAVGVDFAGLTEIDRRYLAAVADRPIGLDAIASLLGEDRKTLEDAIEPPLLQAGLVRRESRGRVATDAGLAHLRAFAPAEPIESDDAGQTCPQMGAFA